MSISFLNCSTRLSDLSYSRLTATARPSFNTPFRRNSQKCFYQNAKSFEVKVKKKSMVLTIINSTEAAVSEFSREILSGFLEFFVAEDLDSKVGACVCDVRD